MRTIKALLTAVFLFAAAGVPAQESGRESLVDASKLLSVALGYQVDLQP